MRRVVWLAVLGVLGVSLGVALARVGGAGAATTSGTTSTPATTTTVTTTGTTTTSPTQTTGTTPTPSYAPLPTSTLPAGCVGGGAVAVVPPSHPVVTVGTPASNLDRSGYPASDSVVTFGSSTVTGWGCRHTKVTLAAVSLFGGAITATEVEARSGRGTVTGLRILGTAVSARAAKTMRVGSWGRLTLGTRIGRLVTPLGVRLLRRHDHLPAGTTIVIAFAALSRRAVAPTPADGVGAAQALATLHRDVTAKGATNGQHRGRGHRKPPDFPKAPSPFKARGGLTDAAQDNPIVAIATRYLGVRYQWGGASPRTGFDCSGLVQYVFGQFGVPLIHFAAAQWHAPGGVWVPPDRLQAGDLVFFTGSDGTRKSPGHVGIYVADGYVIDAPHTGSVVRFDRITEPRLAREYVGARRIVGAVLDARRLLAGASTVSSTAPLPRVSPTPIATKPLAESLGIAAVGTPAMRVVSRGGWIPGGAALAGLVLLLSAGTVLVRRHRREAADVPRDDATS